MKSFTFQLYYLSVEGDRSDTLDQCNRQVGYSKTAPIKWGGGLLNDTSKSINNQEL